MTTNEYTEVALRSMGFFTPDELIKQYGGTNTFLDLASVLISKTVVLGHGNIFYPNVIVQAEPGSTVRIDDKNMFYPDSLILAEQGIIRIGSNNTFGPRGFSAIANTEKAQINIGDEGRYINQAAVYGQSTLGDGSQVLGNIEVINCELAAGGNHTEPDPDKRAAVLKGYGRAIGLQLVAGQVVNGKGNFADAPVERQQAYHPKP